MLAKWAEGGDHGVVLFALVGILNVKSRGKLGLGSDFGEHEAPSAIEVVAAKGPSVVGVIRSLSFSPVAIPSLRP